jgi:hypothetical protein
MIKMAITKKQLIDALDVIQEVTDGYVSYVIGGQLDNRIYVKYYDNYEEYCEAVITIGVNNMVENPKVVALQQDIFNTEQKLVNLKKKLAELTQE